LNIQKANQIWTELGEDDPMWVVLTAQDKRGGKWTQEDFFAHGCEEIDRALRTLHDSGVALSAGSALDFGCGLGRLSQALARHFQSVDGVDVSASMIRQAQQYNKCGDKVRYHLNVKTDLSLFSRGSFDFIYSRIVLQHIPTRHELLYIAEFMDLLKPGGIAYFQTIHAQGLRAVVPNWAVEAYRSVKSRGKPYIPMYGVGVAEVEAVIRHRGCRLENRSEDEYPGWESRFANDFYLVVKPGVA
jgi:2-polyprenyl-3-methyl-5-hydroxy-6-metoxy-1,4-benzoquinol methylase